MGFVAGRGCAVRRLRKPAARERRAARGRGAAAAAARLGFFQDFPRRLPRCASPLGQLRMSIARLRRCGCCVTSRAFQGSGCPAGAAWRQLRMSDAQCLAQAMRLQLQFQQCGSACRGELCYLGSGAIACWVHQFWLATKRGMRRMRSVTARACCVIDSFRVALWQSFPLG